MLIVIIYKFYPIRHKSLFHRYNLPIIIIVVNNNGIYNGLDPETWTIVRDGQDPTIAYFSSIPLLKRTWWLMLFFLLKNASIELAT